MKAIKQLASTITLSAGLLWQAQASAIPINDGTLEYQGAVFSLQAEHISDNNYYITYWADFTNFDNGDAQPFFYALDWKWAGGKITSAGLVEPDSLVDADDWSVEQNHKVNNSNATPGCSDGSAGGEGALCSEYKSNMLGISTSSAGLLSWVYQVTFNKAIDFTSVTGNTLRGIYTNQDGSLAGPIMSCTTGGIGDQVCKPYESPPPDEPPPDEPPNGVPTPLTPLLFGAGLLAMGWVRRRTAKC